MNEQPINGTPAIEDSPEEKNRKIFEGFNREMLDIGLTPLMIIQGSVARDVVALDSGAELHRPFGVFEVALDYEPDSRYIYKSEVPSAESKGMDREVYFYNVVLPKIQKELSEKSKAHIEFPRIGHVYRNGEKPKGILMSKLDGKVLGTHDKAQPGLIKEEDLDAIIDLILAIQKIDPKTIDPDQVVMPDLNYADIEHKRLDHKREAIREILGEEALTQIADLINQSAKAQEAQPLRLLSEDVFTTNLMKLADGRLGSFDWERLHTGRNPADDYGKIVSRLWSEPALQKLLIRKILIANKQIPNFREMFKANLIAREGSHLLHHYHRILLQHESDPNSVSPERHEEAKAGKPAIQKMIQDILDDAGPWSE